jgi:PAS domain S-box-containing protein
LQEIDLQLQALAAGEVDAVIGPGGQSYLLQKAQLKLLQSEGEQRELARQLDAERTRLLAAQAVAKIGSWSFDLITRMSEWTEEMYRICGIESARIQPTYQHIFELVHPDDREAVDTAFRQSLASSEVTMLQYRLTLPDRSKFVESRWQVEHNAQGDAIRVYGTCQDISERKHAEEALQQSQSQLRMASRLGRIGAWSFELSQANVRWSDEVCAIHEVSPGTSPNFEEAIAFYAPEWREAIRRAVQTCATLGLAFDLTLEIITARGNRRWVQAIGEAVRDANGLVRGVQGAFQDLSDRRQVEEESRRLAARLTTTLESLTIGFFIVDRSWRFTYFNAEAERIFARSRHTVLGRNLWTELSQLLDTAFERYLKNAAAEGHVTLVEAPLPGTELWFRITAYPSEEGLAVHWRDVTVERAEHRQLKLLEACVARLNDMIVITEAPLEEPGPEMRFVNDALLRFTGYAHDELIGSTPRLFQGPGTDRAELDRIRDALVRSEPVRSVLVNYKKSGEPYWVEIDIVPVTEGQSGRSYFVAIERDVSERKRDQDALRELNTELEARVHARTVELVAAREEAEQADRAKSTFLATMSHEIRTPMNGVIGLIELLSHTPLQPSQGEMVERLNDSADSLLRIIDDILDFSKIEAGKLRIERAPMRLADVVERVCMLLDPAGRGPQMGLIVFVDPQIPEVVQGDALRLRQVLTNLIGNAIKFSGGLERPGRVAVRVELIEHESQTVRVELTVSDNGIGMDQQTLANLFTPFLQADESTTRRYGGTGLGLAITQMLVRLMGGEVAVSSVPQQGTRFTVRIPFEVVTQAAASVDRAVQGLHCRIVGGDTQLATDLSRSLSYGGAIVKRSLSLEQAVMEGAGRDHPVWILLPEERVPDAAQLQALALTDMESARWLVLLGRGRRRKPRINAAGHVIIDLDVLSRASLFRTVAIAGGRASLEDQPIGKEAARPSEAVPAGGIAAPLSRRILVAEDNDTNREVLTRQLRLLGFAAEIANDGWQALQRWRAEEFDLVLTDLRMPEMDGFALTAAIRAEESAARHTGIIALTANALPHEEARCRAAGMDDYLAKPVRLQRLKAIVKKWLPKQSPSQPSESVKPTPLSVGPPVDLAVLKALIGEDPEGLRAVLESFSRLSEQLQKELHVAIRSASVLAVVEISHKLKSGARSIGASQLGDLCAMLEEAGLHGRTELLAELQMRFDTQLEAVRLFLGSAVVRGS